MSIRIYQMLDSLTYRITKLEKDHLKLLEDHSKAIHVLRNHLIRVKNGEEIVDDMIRNSQPYRDLSPQLAYETYNLLGNDILLIDITSSEFTPPQEIPGRVKLPWNLWKEHFKQLPIDHIAPIFIICENGLNSILACEFLAQQDYYNVNNISGGHEYWPGHQLSIESSHKSP